MRIVEEISKIKKLMFENQTNFNFGYQGDIWEKPGLHIYIFDDKKIGHSNLLNFDDSWDWDWDVERFYSNPQYCVDGCDDGFFNQKNTIYLHDLKVFPKYQGNGYSKLLMNKSHEIAKNLGFDYVSLITSKSNEPAQNLYKGLGYKLHQTNDNKDFYYYNLNK